MCVHKVVGSRSGRIEVFKSKWSVCEVSATLLIAIFRNRDVEADIIGLACQQKLSPNELSTIPLFLRFYNVIVTFWCNYTDPPIETKCKFIENQLRPLKLALNDSNMVQFIANISRTDRRFFSDHSMLLDFIRNRFLPIFNSSRRYKFQIWFKSDTNSDTDVIASILEMEIIKQCSNVEIGITHGEQRRLPIEEISNWLNPSDDGTNNSLRNLRERFLEICYYGVRSPIQDAREMLEHLTKVYFIHLMTWPIITYIFNFNFQIFSITINTNF